MTSTYDIDDIGDSGEKYLKTSVEDSHRFFCGYGMAMGSTVMNCFCRTSTSLIQLWVNLAAWTRSFHIEFCLHVVCSTSSSDNMTHEPAIRPAFEQHAGVRDGQESWSIRGNRFDSLQFAY